MEIHIVKELFQEYTGESVKEVIQLNNSASNRRYYRLKADNISLIAVVGTNRDENLAFIYLSKHFISKGIKVPKVLKISEDSMSYLQEDLGDNILYSRFLSARESGEYSPNDRALLIRTIEALPKIQFEGAKDLDFSKCFPQASFNERMIMFDLNYFKYCFLKSAITDFNEILLQDDFEQMAKDLLAEDFNTFMYRDFQARNIMLYNDDIYFIDFQGGRKGPIYYDLASFIWQARAAYPDDLKEDMLRAYLSKLKDYLPHLDESSFRQSYNLFVLFRTLQVLGAYGFRGYFERKVHFLDSIPYAIANVRQIVEQGLVASYPYLNQVLKQLCNSI